MSHVHSSFSLLPTHFRGTDPLTPRQTLQKQFDEQHPLYPLIFGQDAALFNVQLDSTRQKDNFQTEDEIRAHLFLNGWKVEYEQDKNRGHKACYSFTFGPKKESSQRIEMDCQGSLMAEPDLIEITFYPKKDGSSQTILIGASQDSYQQKYKMLEPGERLRCLIDPKLVQQIYQNAQTVGNLVENSLKTPTPSSFWKQLLIKVNPFGKKD